MSVLVIAEIDEGKLGTNVRHAVTAAAQLGAGDIHLLAAGDAMGNAANEGAKIGGVALVKTIEDACLAKGIAENIAPVVVSVVKEEGYSHVVMTADTFGKNIAPRIAALLDTQQISDITAVVSTDTFERPIYAGNAIARVKSSDSVRVVTARSVAFEAAEDAGGAAPIEAVAAAVEASSLVSFVGREESSSDRPELTSARIVVSGGRGMAASENFAMLESIADKLGAAVGASRAAVDAGYAPNDWQVGQTGKVVAPDLYIAVGISGAIQHLAGMKDSKVIVAINKDEDAPIFQVSDYGIVGDLFTLVPELSDAL